MKPWLKRITKLGWVAQLALALAVGVLIRRLRRLIGLPPRICHGVYPMHMVRDMVGVDRLAGFPSHSLVNHVRLAPCALVTEVDFDVVLEKTRRSCHLLPPDESVETLTLWHQRRNCLMQLLAH